MTESVDPRILEVAFQIFAQGRGVDLADSLPSVGLSTMLCFYREHRADGCKLEEKGDMLLYQWGTYDWGEGEAFELDLTRQVILPDEEDDDAIWQLHVTYRFTPTAKLRSIGSGNRWCPSPQEATTFEAFIKNSAAYIAVAHLRASEIEVLYECAG